LCQDEGVGRAEGVCSIVIRYHITIYHSIPVGCKTNTDQQDRRYNPHEAIEHVKCIPSWSPKQTALLFSTLEHRDSDSANPHRQLPQTHSRMNIAPHIYIRTAFPLSRIRMETLFLFFPLYFNYHHRSPANSDDDETFALLLYTPLARV
jgi:hypothetical protein